MDYQWLISFAAALVVGLLIGLDRERQNEGDGEDAIAGLRTFTLASLAGLVAASAGGTELLAMAVGAAALLAAVAYWSRSGDDVGLTTELALVLTVAIGGLALERPQEATAAGVAVAILLAARRKLHGFARQSLTGAEFRDGLILAAATFIVLPVLPDRPVDPFSALNPHSIWTSAVLVLAISGAGYVAERLLGPRFGLAIAGLASGFVSSAATIGAMGSRVRSEPALLGPASVGAILSTVATAVQLAIVLAATSFATFLELLPAVLLAGAGAVGYAVVFGLRLSAAGGEAPGSRAGGAFSLVSALVFAGVLALVLLATAVIGDRFGAAGLAVTAGLAGLLDTHSPSIAVASRVATGHISATDAVIPVLMAFSANSIVKAVVAFTSGGPQFALRVVPGLALVAAGLWTGGLLF